MKRFAAALGLGLIVSSLVRAAPDPAGTASPGQAGNPRLMVQAGHGPGMAVVQSISPNGQLVATGDDVVIKLWSTDAGKLVCELKPDRQARIETPSRRADDGRNGITGGAISFAWSADGMSLYVPKEKTTLVRYDLSRCRQAGTVQVKLPDPRTRPRKIGDPVKIENDIEEVSTLKDGQVLLRATSGLYALRIDGEQSTATLLADLQQPDAELPQLNLQDLLSREAMERKVLSAFSSMGDLSIGGHSADGRVVVLTAQSIHLGPMIFPLSTADVQVASAGQVSLLSSFQGAAPSYRGASVAAVSAQGHWLAIRSSADGGARISLFDVPARKLVSQIVLKTEGGPQISAGMMSSMLQPAYAQAGAVAGMAFSPDEKRLLLLRPRTEAKADMLDDPTLEIHTVGDLKLERRVNLRGAVVPEADMFTGMVSMSGTAVMTSADQGSFVFQNSSLTRGATMVAAHWKSAATPVLSAWAATEGPVAALAFLDDRHLLSTHVMTRGEANAPAQPPKDTRSAAVQSAMNSFTMTQQVMNWSFDTGSATRVFRGPALMGGGNSQQAVSVGDRTLRTEIRYLPPDQIRHELVMQTMPGDTPVWRRDFTDPDGFVRRPVTLALSQDRKLVAILLSRDPHPKAQAPVAPAPPAPATNPNPPAPAEPTPKQGGLLGGLLRGGTELADRFKQILPGQKPGTIGTEAPGSTSSRSDSQLQLLDAQSGQTLAVLDVEQPKNGESTLTFINGQRLLFGRSLIEVQSKGSSYALSAQRGAAVNGQVIGVTLESARPIVANGSADAGLRAVVLPGNLVRAKLAAASRDDRLVAVFADGGIFVHDNSRQMQAVFSADLVGEAATAMALSPSGRHLAVGTSRGSVKLFDLGKQRLVATLLSPSDGSWVVADPEGRLDSSNLGDNPALHWIMDDDPLHPLPFDTAMRANYVPNLLPLLLDGVDALDAVPQLAGRNRVTPLVSIDKVDAMPGKAGLVQVKVTVTPQTSAKGQASGAMDLRLFRNGRLVGYAPEQDGALELDARTGRYSRTFNDIRLLAGSSTIQFSAHAFNTDGMKSQPATFNYKPPKPVTLPAARAYVLAIGINAYEGQAFNTLGFAVNDARLIATEVSESLKRTKAFSEVVAVTLESALAGRNDATKARIQAALGVLAGRPDSAKLLAGIAGAERLAAATPADLVIVTFAGHGYVSDRTRDLHLVPSDVAAATGTEGLKRFDARSISAAELDHWLRDVDAGQMSLVVDACHSAAAVTADFKAGPMGSRGLGQLAVDKGMRILAATQAADSALEHAELKHGFLTYALISEGLSSGLADLRPNDGRIDLEEWLNYPVERVPALQEELRQGAPKLKVAGQLPRSASRPDGPVASPAKYLQQPKLIGWVASGNTVPVIRLVLP